MLTSCQLRVISALSLTPESIKLNRFLKLILLEHKPCLACFGFVTRQKWLASRNINLRKRFNLIDSGVKSWLPARPLGPETALGLWWCVGGGLGQDHLGPLGFKCSQHGPTTRPSVERTAAFRSFRSFRSFWSSYRFCLSKLCFFSEHPRAVSEERQRGGAYRPLDVERGQLLREEA